MINILRTDIKLRQKICKDFLAMGIDLLKWRDTDSMFWSMMRKLGYKGHRGQFRGIDNIWVTNDGDTIYYPAEWNTAMISEKSSD